VQEMRSDGVTRTFAYGNYIDEPLCMVTSTAGTSDTVYYLQGNNYNIAALTDEAGHVVEHYGIEPYGTFAVRTGKGADGVWLTADDLPATASAVGNEVVFQGRTVDGETGDYHFRYRQYGPIPGRFFARDPLGLNAVDIDAYVFGLNDPTNLVDPLGLEANGCGPAGWKGKLVPDNPFWIANFQPACNGHDECYEKCAADKAKCDEDFWVAMYWACWLNHGWWNPYKPSPPGQEAKLRMCNATADLYHAAVLKFGQPYFDEAQEAAGKCCKEEEE